jgi:hypothetical protein
LVEVVEEDDDDDGEELDSRSWKDLTPEEQDRIEAARARREFNRLAKRIKNRGDRELNRAVNTLMKRVDEPGLWWDLRTLLELGGPAADHAADHGDEDF